ncbi:MAG TPA: DbpA RNA binding domain-containing protein [Gemmatimonadales bacterium]|nr:DbpA RNA binding domain-containing protein [Gemmatimonadales bacterium]
MTTLDEGRAALERGRHVVVVAPPAPEQAGDLWRLLPSPHPAPSSGPAVVIACPDEVCAAAWAAAARPDWRVHAVTGLARAARTLASHPPDALAGSTADLMALVGQSVLKLEAVPTLVIAWPEQAVATGAATELDAILGAAPDARRIVLSWNPGRLSDFLERHARRAEIVGELPVDADGKPLSPLGPARYAVAAALPEHRATLLRDTLDLLAPARPLVWDGGEITPPLPTCDAVICLTLPTRAQFAALTGLSAGAPVMFVTGGQLPYLRSIAAPLAPLALSSSADRARDRAAALRERIGRRIEQGEHDAELALLDPLFERYDPAEVAAAILGLLGDVGRGTEGATSDVPRPAPPPSWTKVFLNVGKKDRAGAKDLVGALIREVGLEKSQIGRIDVRETFSVVEVAPSVVERAVQALGGVTVRGRRVAARLDRYA